MQITLFLKRVLLLDAASCLGMGAMLIFGADLLSGPFGMSAALLEGAGIALLPIGLYMGWLGLRLNAAAMFVWLVILGNAAWVAKSLALAFGHPEITPLGIAFVTSQAAFVLLMAILEYTGVRRATATA
ncbi:hypothetical protein RCO27_15965 [Sphingosinicella sp. LHD-64]|uniref:hypothetical protein n=1 Tax=Sphingosinicella sp. LHD-64 TaxID=3072139 RepID=UPI00280FA942|nr:hypothetical protein [Sphingosinicella sp. LHD-64]MDQ8757725.1 hypothetical protein [Sphingosinicella sp. LHD-64]